MKLLYIGAGFVGSCSAAVAADSGHEAMVYDVDENKIQKLGSGDRDVIQSCLFEEGLGDLLARNKERVVFTSDYERVEKFLDICDAIFLCVPTPEVGETGATDLTYYNLAAEELGRALAKRNGGSQEKYIVVVNKSTVPIEMIDKTDELLKNMGAKNFGLASNPEFLVEGKAVRGSLKPDRIVMGAWNEKDFGIMRQIYQRFFDSPSTQYIEANPKEAAAGKLLANFYLFNRVAVCYDVAGRVCETFPSVKFENIRRIVTSDSRLGDWGFYDSLYCGGSCFIKDSRSLSHQLRQAGQSADLIDGVYLANKRQLENFLNRAQSEAGFDWNGKTIAILGLSFKRDTNDIRNSPAVMVMNFLKDKIAKARLYDPAAANNFQTIFPADERVEYFAHEFEAVKGADAIVIATDWPQFRGLADVMIQELKERPLILDGRRMLQHRYADLRSAGFKIIAVGSPLIS